MTTPLSPRYDNDIVTYRKQTITGKLELAHWVMARLQCLLLG